MRCYWLTYLPISSKIRSSISSNPSKLNFLRLAFSFWLLSFLKVSNFSIFGCSSFNSFKTVFSFVSLSTLILRSELSLISDSSLISIIGICSSTQLLISSKFYLSAYSFQLELINLNLLHQLQLDERTLHLHFEKETESCQEYFELLFLCLIVKIDNKNYNNNQTEKTIGNKISDLISHKVLNYFRKALFRLLSLN